MYKAIIAIGILAAACLAAGCGGSSDETAAAAVTEPQFMKQARTICSKTQKELAVTVAGNGIDFGRASSLLKREAEELEAIEGPDSVESKVEPLVASVTKASEIFAREKQDALEDPRIVAYKTQAGKLHLGSC